MSKTSRTNVEDIQLRLKLQVELARGASHISSTLSSSSTAAAVAEVLDKFIVDRGMDTLEDFRTLLVQDLKKRGCVEGARAVDAYLRTKPSRP